MKKTKLLALAGLVLGLSVFLAACGQKEEPSGSSKDEGWKPTDTIEIIAPASPGGGWDMTARSMQAALKDLVDQNIIVTNKPGGSGSIGWTYLHGKKGNGHYLAMNSSLLLTNKPLGINDLTVDDFTQMAILTSEWECIAVSPDSPYKTGKDVMDALKKDPTSLTIGVGTAFANDDHISFVKAADEAGVDVSKLNYVVFESGGDSVKQLLGGNVDVITGNVSEMVDQHKAGNIRIAAVASKKRLKGLPDVPTWKDLGIDVVFPHWRGVMGPPDMTREQIDFWNKTLAKMVKTDSWKDSMKKMRNETYYLNSKEAKAFLNEQSDYYTKIIDMLR